MALIKCPECGQEISDQAKKCIHCGKELFHCPECGKVTVRHGNTCPQCGYVLPEAPKPAPAPAASAAPAGQAQQGTSPEPQTDIMKAWEAARPAEAQRRTIFQVISALVAVGGIIPFILLFFHLVGLIFPLTKEAISANGIGYFADCRKFIDDAFTAMVVLSCFSVVVRFFVQYWRVIPAANWLKKGTFDIDGTLKREEISLSKEKSEGYWAAYCALSPKGKINLAFYSFALAILQIDMVFFCAAFHDIAIERLECTIVGAEFSFTFPWVMFVCLVAVFIIAIIFAVIGTQSCKKFLKSYASKEEQKS